MIKKVTALGCYLCQIFLSFWCWDLCREHVSMQFVPLFHFFVSSISLVCLLLGSTLSFGFSFLCFVVLSSVPLTLFHLHLIFFFFFFVILINSLLPCRLSVLFLFSSYIFVFFFQLDCKLLPTSQLYLDNAIHFLTAFSNHAPGPME